jgi:hypothetical protein
VAASLAAVTGCGSDEPPADKPSTRPTATESKDPHAAEKKDLLDVYQKMVEIEERIYATVDYDEELEKYAAHKALSNIKTTMFYHDQNDTVMKGDVKRSPEVTAFNAEADPMKAVVTDCADSTKYNEVKKKTGEAVPYDGPRRHIVTGTAYRTEDGWKFFEYAVDRERTC